MWLLNPDWDPRIAEHNVRIQEGSAVEGSPIPLHDKRKPESLIAYMEDHLGLIGEVVEACREFLEAVARYELQREDKKPSKKILDAIDDLGIATGIEYGTDAVEELD